MVGLTTRNSRCQIDHDGLKRTYYLHVPPNHDSSKPVPLVFVFHGSDMTASGMQRICKMDEQADAHGFITVYPEGLNKCWNDGRGIAERENRDDVGFVLALIEVLSKQYAIDAQRIYACGLSNGGFFCQYLAGRSRNTFAAIASVAASVPDDACWESAAVVPIILFLGDKDKVIPHAGGPVRVLLRGNRGTVKSAAEAVDYWVRRNVCDTQPTKQFQEHFSDGSGYGYKEYSSVEIARCVVCYTVHGGGHTWPGGRRYLPELVVGRTVKLLAASEIIWNFFQEHTHTRSQSAQQ